VDLAARFSQTFFTRASFHRGEEDLSSRFELADSALDSVKPAALVGYTVQSLREVQRKERTRKKESQIQRLGS